MRNVFCNKFKWLTIYVIFLFSINLLGYSSKEFTSSASVAEKNSVSVQITESTVITFSDKNLEQTIRDEIQCPTEDNLKYDVNDIIKLQNAGDKNNSNLSVKKDSTDLDLDNNQISNVKP
ncbi:hypothetical protein [Clostridium sp. FP1]|uniref:hypothetical protein n=1 Tax=Clostridium sp. FP1 TaxID=2724076 RepID=UPI0013E93AA7|nr:hypothetical protein [Clostridium sp. FP1]MBZ9633562.1 hypothetical protein [Clostridium sp. FP1]